MIKPLNTQRLLINKRKINSKIVDYLTNEKNKKLENISQNKIKENNYNNSIDFFLRHNASVRNKGIKTIHWKGSGKLNSNNVPEESNNYFKPFDLYSIFYNELKNIKEIISKELSSKKLKFNNKNNIFSIIKNNNHFEIKIIKNVDNIFLIKGLIKKGNKKFFKEILKEIISKLN